MTTRVTDGARRERLFFLLRLPPSFLASRGFAAQRSRARALPLLNLKKKRYCSQSNSCNVEKRHLYVNDVRLVGPSARKGHFVLFLQRKASEPGSFPAVAHIFLRRIFNDKWRCFATRDTGFGPGIALFSLYGHGYWSKHYSLPVSTYPLRGLFFQLIFSFVHYFEATHG